MYTNSSVIAQLTKMTQLITTTNPTLKSQWAQSTQLTKSTQLSKTDSTNKNNSII